MNMLIGVLCEIVCTISENSKEELRIDFMKETLLEVLDRVDA